MFCESLKKVLEKINEGIVNLRVPLSTTIGNRVHRKAIFAAICILTIVFLGTIIENFSSTKTVAYADSVKGIGAGIYWDQTCTNRTLTLNWGPIKPGSNNTLTIYAKNEGNSAVSLSLGTANWNPSASLTYISLSWNYSSQALSANQVIALELTLTASPTTSGITSFNFDTIITTTSER